MPRRAPRPLKQASRRGAGSRRRPPAGPEPNNGTRPGAGPEDLAPRVELAAAPEGPPSRLLEVMARVLRGMRDRERVAGQAGAREQSQEAR